MRTTKRKEWERKYRENYGDELRKKDRERWPERAKKESYKRAEFKRRLKTYGITKEDYALMEEDQGFKCAICRIEFADLKRKPSIDHSHETGIVRGLLCQSCNMALGLMKDDIVRLKAASSYLIDNQES